MTTSTLNLGCGDRPEVGATNHDRIEHSPWIDVVWDLDKLPWPWADEEWDKVQAYDVMEHLHLEVNEWLEECWRILKPGGKLELRLPAFDNHLSYRDPTHRRVFHPESFFYWDPGHQLWEHFGRYYWDAKCWWDVSFVGRESDDLRFDLFKQQVAS